LKNKIGNDNKNAFFTKGVFSFCLKFAILLAVGYRMTVYIEYVFLENYLLDFLLLRLALRGAKERVKLRRLALGAVIGGVFAVVYPLSNFPKFCQILLKFAVGALMCAVSFGKMKNKNAIGRYAFTLILFFVFSFSFAGALTFFNAWGLYVFLAFGWCVMIAEGLIKVFYRKKAQKERIYACEIIYKRKKIEAFGLYDTGNLARYQNVPVCFVAPDVLYDLLGEDFYGKPRGQVCDELRICTINGEKRLAVYRGKILIEKKEKTVYFAVGAHIVNKAYTVLLNGGIFEEEKEVA
jgi:hypothetical protein